MKAGHSGRTAQGMSCLRLLEHWYHGFESHSRRDGMSVYVYSVFVLFCMLVAALRRAHPPSKDSYRLRIGLGNLKRRQGPTKDCKAIRTYIHKLECENSLRSLKLLALHVVTFL
jgi:hypothetical protein